MPFDHTREYLALAYQVLELGVTPPAPETTVVGLIRSGASIPATPGLPDFVQAEIIPDNPINGYSRQILGQTITAIDSTGDTLTVPEHGRTANQEVYIVGSASVPSPLLKATPYYIVTPSTNTLKLSLTVGGAAIDIAGGYSGSSLFLKMGSAFNATNKRQESIYDQVAFTATGSDIVYQGVFIATYATTVPSSIIASVDTTNDVINTIANHNLSTRDRVHITADTGGSMPGGLATTTSYWIRNLSTTSFSLHNSADNAAANSGKVDITSIGTGTLRWRNAKGTSVGWDYFATPITIPAGRTQLIQIPAYLSNQRTALGVP